MNHWYQHQPPAPLRDVVVDWDVRSDDVLCGRTSTSTSHVGNKRFRAIVNSFCERYQNTTSRAEKKSITNEVAFIVQQGDAAALGGGGCGRFLKQVEEFVSPPNYWVPLSPAEVHEKVSHALRSTKARCRSSVSSTSASTSSSNDGQYMEEEEGEETLFRRISRVQQQIYEDLLEKNCRSEPDNEIRRCHTT